jgi:hypothetical protein
LFKKFQAPLEFQISFQKIIVTKLLQCYQHAIQRDIEKMIVIPRLGIFASLSTLLPSNRWISFLGENWLSQVTHAPPASIALQRQPKQGVFGRKNFNKSRL